MDVSVAVATAVLKVDDSEHSMADLSGCLTVERWAVSRVAQLGLSWAVHWADLKGERKVVMKVEQRAANLAVDWGAWPVVQTAGCLAVDWVDRWDEQLAASTADHWAVCLVGCWAVPMAASTAVCLVVTTATATVDWPARLAAGMHVGLR